MIQPLTLTVLHFIRMLCGSGSKDFLLQAASYSWSENAAAQTKREGWRGRERK